MAESYITKKGGGGGDLDYTNSAVQDTNGAKYELYNGYDYVTSRNTSVITSLNFNRWALNNSTTKPIIFNNTVMNTSLNFNGPGTTTTSTNMYNYSSPSTTAMNRGNISPTSLSYYNNRFYFGWYTYFFSNGFQNRNNPNLSVLPINNTGNFSQIYTLGTPNLSGWVRNVSGNNGYFYTAGFNYANSANTVLRKYFESNGALAANSSVLTGSSSNIAINNGFVYLTAGSNIMKFYESNLIFVGNLTITPNIHPSCIWINNGFLFAAANRKILKYHETNLGFHSESTNIVTNGSLESLTGENNFIYVLRTENPHPYNSSVVTKIHENNLVVAGNTSTFGLAGPFYFTINDAKMFVVGQTWQNTIVKVYRQNDLQFLGQTNRFDLWLNTEDSGTGYVQYSGQVRGLAVGSGQIAGISTVTAAGRVTTFNEYTSITFQNNAIFQINKRRD